jgi:hypothetical protein
MRETRLGLFSLTQDHAQADRGTLGNMPGLTRPLMGAAAIWCEFRSLKNSINPHEKNPRSS